MANTSARATSSAPTVDAEAGMLRVFVAGRDLAFDDNVALVVAGRGHDADICLDDTRISRRHVALRVEDECWWIDDLESENGTYCDGRRIDHKMVVDTTAIMLADPLTGIEIVLEPAAARSGATVRLSDTRSKVVRIGRAPENDVVILDARASRYHAELRLLDDDTIEVVDLASTNGTRVDSRAISRASYPPPAHLEIAGHEIEVHIDAARGLLVELMNPAQYPGPSPTVAINTPPITNRERELVALVAGGATDREIAAALFISVRTVRSHLDRIKDKTNRRRRADLTRMALELGIEPQTPASGAV